MKRRFLAVFAVVAAATSAADGVRVGGPLLGFIRDDSQRLLRPVLGLPGAASVGAPLLLDQDLGRVAINVERRFALASVAPDSRVWVLRGLDGDVVRQEIAEVLPGPDRIFLSPSGTAAMLYYSDRGAIQVITGLPDDPVSRNVQELVTPGETVHPVAISDSGEEVLLAGSDTGLSLFGSGGVRVLVPQGPVEAAEFLRKGRTAVFATGRSVFRINDVQEDSAIIPVGDVPGESAVTALASSRDSKTLFAITADSDAVVLLDMSGGLPQSLACSCTPKVLERLEGNSVFRISDGEGVMWVLDADGETPRMVLVPMPSEGDPQ